MSDIPKKIRDRSQRTLDWYWRGGVSLPSTGERTEIRYVTSGDPPSDHPPDRAPFSMPRERRVPPSVRPDDPRRNAGVDWDDYRRYSHLSTASNHQRNVVQPYYENMRAKQERGPSQGGCVQGHVSASTTTSGYGHASQQSSYPQGGYSRPQEYPASQGVQAYQGGTNYEGYTEGRETGGWQSPTQADTQEASWYDNGGDESEGEESVRDDRTMASLRRGPNIRFDWNVSEEFQAWKRSR